MGNELQGPSRPPPQPPFGSFRGPPPPMHVLQRSALKAVAISARASHAFPEYDGSSWLNFTAFLPPLLFGVAPLVIFIALPQSRRSAFDPYCCD